MRLSLLFDLLVLSSIFVALPANALKVATVPGIPVEYVITSDGVIESSGILDRALVVFGFKVTDGLTTDTKTYSAFAWGLENSAHRPALVVDGPGGEQFVRR